MLPAENDPDSLANLIKRSYDLERSGNASAALASARLALERARDQGFSEIAAAALVCIAQCQQHLGHYQAATALAEEALNTCRDDSRPCADALRVLGDCAHEAGHLEAAEEYYHRAIDIARLIGYHHALQRCLHSLSACVYITRGQFELALGADEESLRLALELDMPEVAWLPLLTMGWVYWVTGQRERALAIIEEMRSFVQSGSIAEGYYFCLRADLAQDGENPDSALSLYTRARAIAEVVGDPGLNAELRLGLSRHYLAADNTPAAHGWADDAYSIAHRAGNQDLQGCALIERGRAAWQLGNPAQGESDLLTAIEVLTPMQANYDLARAGFLLAALLHSQGRPESGPAWREAANRILQGGYTFYLERERALAFPLLSHHLNSAEQETVDLSTRLLDFMASLPPPPLRIYTLGRFDVRQGVRLIPEHAWRQRRAGELFRLLLVSHRRTIFRDQVILLLWPEKSPAAAQALLHQATSSLRRVLEPELPDKFPSRYLSVDAGLISLHLPEGSWVDFEAFDTHCENQNWEMALECYRGDLFPADLYSDWAAERRERLKQNAIQAALAVAKAALEAARPSKALSTCWFILGLEPWQEEAVLLGMKACMAQNDRAGAIRVYKKLEQALREELNITPQEAVYRYYRELLES